MKVLKFFTVVLVVLAFNACFSTWTGDEGIVTIAFGKPARSLGDIEGMTNLLHKVILENPGVYFEENFTGKNAVIKIAPGKYNLTVKTYEHNLDGDIYYDYLLAMSTKVINVKAGYNPPESMKMTSAAEAYSFFDLKNKCEEAENPEDIIIILKNSIPTPEDIETISAPEYLDDTNIYVARNVRLIAEKDVSIFWADACNGYGDLFELQEGACLKLGSENMKGSITIDGSTSTKEMPGRDLRGVTVWEGASLEMNNRVSFVKFTSTVINIVSSSSTGPGDAPGLFTMNGGTISNNAPEYDSIIMNNGIFVLNNGTINNNSTKNSIIDNVYNTVFTMNNGTISNNSTQNSIINNGNNCKFTMNNGTISKNSGTSGGAVNNNGDFIMNGGLVINNKAIQGFDEVKIPFGGNGGGIYNGVENSTFFFNNGTISGNNAACSGGGIFNEGTVWIVNGKITNNQSVDKGGGIYTKVDIVYSAGASKEKNVTNNKPDDVFQYIDEGGIKYAIIISPETNGKIDIWPGVACERVDIDIRPSYDMQGYEVKTVRVTQNSNGKEIEINKTTMESYTFKMPASAVTVFMEFKAIPYNIKAIIPQAGGTFEYSVNGVKSATGIINDKVEIVCFPVNGYFVSYVSVQYLDGSLFPMVLDPKSENFYVFDMPACDVEITVVFSLP